MGYRKVPVIYTLEIGGDYKGLIVRVKSIKIGEMRRMLRLIDSEEENTTEVLDNMVTLISKGLVSWNLQEEDGEPTPATAEEVDNLDFKMLEAILNEWLDQVSGPDDELGKDSSSGSQFPGLPPTMEAL